MPKTQSRNAKKKSLFNLGYGIGINRLSIKDRFSLDSADLEELRDSWKPNVNYKRKDN